MPTSLSECLALNWRPGWTEPHVMDWLTIGTLYLVAALAPIVIGHQGAAAGRRFWGLVMALALVIGLGKQFDLADGLAAALACRAGDAAGEAVLGLHRKLSLGLGIGSLLLLVPITLALGRRAVLNLGALAGLTIMAVNGLIRVAGLPAADSFLAIEFIGARVADLVQVVGPMLLLMNALMLIDRPAARGRRRRRRRSGSRSPDRRSDGPSRRLTAAG